MLQQLTTLESEKSSVDERLRGLQNHLDEELTSLQEKNSLLKNKLATAERASEATVSLKEHITRLEEEKRYVLAQMATCSNTIGYAKQCNTQAHNHTHKLTHNKKKICQFSGRQD